MGIDKKHYADAALEVANGYIDSALYVKALALADGDDKRAKAAYIGLRAEELQLEGRKAKIAEVVGGAAGLTVGTAQATAQAAAKVARSFEFRTFLAVVIAFLIGVFTFLLSLALVASVMHAMGYDLGHASNLVPLILGCTFFAVIVGWLVGKAILPPTTA
ncbi:MAG TPA: hypothetical protein VFF91_03130 [Pseudoxanthomonas sp.]|nr:hypothetical protein [Pseudoxanthomonas sp.]